MILTNENGQNMTTMRTFEHIARCLVEEHIRVFGEETALGGIKSPDKLKDAIADALRMTWNDGVSTSLSKTRDLLVD